MTEDSKNRTFSHKLNCSIGPHYMAFSEYILKVNWKVSNCHPRSETIGLKVELRDLTIWNHGGNSPGIHSSFSLKHFGRDYKTGFPIASTYERDFFQQRRGRLSLWIQECLLFKKKNLLSSKRSWDPPQKKKTRRGSEKERENNIFSLFFLMHYSPSREMDIDFFFF